MFEPITEYHLTEHAIQAMKRRQIDESLVAAVLARPENAYNIRKGRAVYQSRIQMGDPATSYLIRIFVDIDRNPPDVVTVYRTRKIQKYWSETE